MVCCVAFVRHCARMAHRGRQAAQHAAPFRKACKKLAFARHGQAFAAPRSMHRTRGWHVIELQLIKRAFGVVQHDCNETAYSFYRNLVPSLQTGRYKHRQSGKAAPLTRSTSRTLSFAAIPSANPQAPASSNRFPSCNPRAVVNDDDKQQSCKTKHNSQDAAVSDYCLISDSGPNCMSPRLQRYSSPATSVTTTKNAPKQHTAQKQLTRYSSCKLPFDASP
jgi:hypothetical protein